MAEPAAHPPARARLLAQPGRDLLLRHPAQSATPNDGAALADLEIRLLTFQDHDQQIATPFEWKSVSVDLDRLLNRVAAHQAALAA
jgi:hypothetical protein